jgi:two-component system C4-dicarboxylate transport sensor histidine kinase DctB
MSEQPDTGAPDRALAVAKTFDPDNLAYVNRMTSLGLVVPSVAHEINNTLQIIGALVELLSAKDLPSDVRDKLAKIGGQTSRAVELMHQLVAFVRRDGPGGARGDLQKAVDAALALRRYHLARAGIDVRTSVPAGQTVVAADPQAVEQLVLNLVVNAEQALTGRAEREIRIEIARDNGRATLVVRDNGRGLAPDQVLRAFEPFFTTHRERAGLGLTVARAIASRYDGSVTLTSEPGRGTTVEVSLPTV